MESESVSIEERIKLLNERIHNVRLIIDGSSGPEDKNEGSVEEQEKRKELDILLALKIQLSDKLQRLLDKIKKEKYKQVQEHTMETSRVILNGILWEQVYNQKTGVCKYISWDKKSNTYKYKPTLKDDEKQLTYIPMCEQDDWLKKGHVPIAEEPIDYVSFDNLYNEILGLIHYYLQVPDDRERILTYYSIFTWFINEIDTCAYLLCIGDFGHGKTRLVDIMKKICYKAHPMLNPRGTHIMRTLDLSPRCTLVINENTSVPKNVDDDDLGRIYCAGNQAGNSIPRCIEGKAGEDYKQKLFDPYSPKIFCSYNELINEALNSRCIKIYIKQKTRKEIPIQLGTPFERKTKKIQGMLLDFLLKNYDNPIFEKSKNEENADFNKVGNCRVAQILQPFLVLSAFDDKIIPFIISIAEQQEQNLIEDAISSYKGKIFRAYLDVSSELDDVRSSDVANKLNKGLPQDSKDRIKPNSVGSQLRSLGFKTNTDRNNRFIIKDIELVEEKLQRYAFVDERETLLKAYVKDETPKPKSQQTLNAGESQQDKINRLRLCLEMNKESLTKEQLKEEDFSEEFLNRCIEDRIIYVKPDKTIGVN